MEQPVDKTISYALVISPAAMGLDQALQLGAAESLRGTSGPSDGGEPRDRAKQGSPSRNRTRKQKGRLAAPFSSSGVRRSGGFRSEEHTSELQSLMRISYAVFCLTQTTIPNQKNQRHNYIP